MKKSLLSLALLSLAVGSYAATVYSNEYTNFSVNGNAYFNVSKFKDKKVSLASNLNLSTSFDILIPNQDTSAGFNINFGKLLTDDLFTPRTPNTRLIGLYPFASYSAYANVPTVGYFQVGHNINTFQKVLSQGTDLNNGLSSGLYSYLPSFGIGNYNLVFNYQTPEIGGFQVSYSFARAIGVNTKTVNSSRVVLSTQKVEKDGKTVEVNTKAIVEDSNGVSFDKFHQNTLGLTYSFQALGANQAGVYLSFNKGYDKAVSTILTDYNRVYLSNAYGLYYTNTGLLDNLTLTAAYQFGFATASQNLPYVAYSGYQESVKSVLLKTSYALNNYFRPFAGVSLTYATKTSLANAQNVNTQNRTLMYDFNAGVNSTVFTYKSLSANLYLEGEYQTGKTVDYVLDANSPNSKYMLEQPLPQLNLSNYYFGTGFSLSF